MAIHIIVLHKTFTDNCYSSHSNLQAQFLAISASCNGLKFNEIKQKQMTKSIKYRHVKMFTHTQLPTHCIVGPLIAQLLIITSLMKCNTYHPD